MEIQTVCALQWAVTALLALLALHAARESQKTKGVYAIIFDQGEALGFAKSALVSAVLALVVTLA